MLRLQLCSKCGARVSSDSSYFCHSCGARLDRDVENHLPAEGSNRGESAPIPPTSKGVSLPKSRWFRVLLCLIGALLMLVVIVFVSKLFFSLIIDKAATTVEDNIRRGYQTPAPITQGIEASFAITPHSLGETGLDRLVPGDVSYYLEGQSPQELLPWLWEGGALQASISSQTQYSLEEISSYLERDFVLFERGSGEVGFVSRVVDIEFWRDLLDTLEITDPYWVQVSSGVLIVTNSQSLLEDVERAARKAILSIALSSDYSKSRRRLPAEGQFWFFRFNYQKPTSSSSFHTINSLLQDINGTGFVITTDGSRTVLIGEDTQ